MHDMKNIGKLGKLGSAAGDGTMKAFSALNDAAMADGAIPKKYKELIALGVALTTQCAYCLEIHKRAAKNAGATENEIAEVVFVAAALRAGGAVTHGTHLIDD